MSDALSAMILGGLTPEEALRRNRKDLLARLRGDVVAEIVTQRSGRSYFLSAEEAAARAAGSAAPNDTHAGTDTVRAA